VHTGSEADPFDAVDQILTASVGLLETNALPGHADFPLRLPAASSLVSLAVPLVRHLGRAAQGVCARLGSVDDARRPRRCIAVEAPQRVVSTGGIPQDTTLPPGSSTVEVVFVADVADHPSGDPIEVMVGEQHPTRAPDQHHCGQRIVPFAVLRAVRRRSFSSSNTWSVSE
jgi:hypothetical protein